MQHLRTIVLVVIALFGPLAYHGLAQDRDAAPAGDAIIVHSEGFETLAVDPKDQSLVRVMRMLVEDRLLELPAELEEPVPAAAIQFFLQRLMGPWTLQAGVMPGEELDLQAMQMGAPPPIYAQWTFHTEDAAAAEALAGRFGAVLPLPAEPHPDWPAFQTIAGGPMPLHFGTTNKNGRHGFVIALNAPAPAPAGGALAGLHLDLPRGVEPAAVFAFDSRQLSPLLEQVIDDENEQMKPIATQLRAMGLMGPDASVMTVAVAEARAAGEPRHFAMRYTNYRQIMDQTGMMPGAMLSEADFQRVPADSTYAQIGRAKLSNLLQSLEAWMPDEMAMDDLLTQIEAHTGIHPQRDVLDHLGEVNGLYMSDTTGNGGLFSLAGFVEVTNEAALSETIARLCGQVNQAAQMFARGYVRLGDREVQGQSITTLMFPGLPVPLEVSFALTDGYLYAAMSPQGLLGAIAQGRGDSGGLLDNPRFASGVNVDGALQVTFSDTPRTLRDGYGVMSLGMAALANAARSPVNPDRDPGVLMPSLAELSQNVHAMRSVVRFDGDDMVMTGTLDRSWLVTGTATVGAMGGLTGLMVPAALAGTVLPALGTAREQAKITRSMSNLRSAYMAVSSYAAERDGQWPPSMQTLVDDGYIEQTMLQSPHGPAMDGEDYFFNPTVKDFHSPQPHRHVLAYDRAMLAQRGTTAVLFVDGHVETLEYYELEMLVESEEVNAGVDFNLPHWW